MQNEYTFFLTQGNTAEICTRIAETGLGNVHVWIGENLSYQNEKIMHGSAKELTAYQAAGCRLWQYITRSREHLQEPDCRTTALSAAVCPMTKREIRASVVSRIAPAKNACIYDIGAGTGSVTVELAMQVYTGAFMQLKGQKKGAV